jgi:ABC-type transport system substrate-binding protein
VNALKTGQLNTALAAYGNYADWQSLGSGFKVSRVQVGNLMDITINTSKAPFNNPDVTKAISMAIDRAAINKSLFNGECMPTSAPLPVGAGSSAAANNQWKYSVKDAKALLAKAGTPNVTINAITIPGIWDTVGQAMRPMLAEAGITLNLRTVSPNELRSTYASGATDAIMLQLNSEVDPLIFLRNNYLTFQMLGTPPAEVKDSIDAMASMQIGSPKRTAELAKVNMYIARNPIHLVICNISNLYAASTKVQGIQDMGWAKTGGGNTDPRGLWVAR